MEQTELLPLNLQLFAEEAPMRRLKLVRKLKQKRMKKSNKNNQLTMTKLSKSFKNELVKSRLKKMKQKHSLNKL